jgi:hypothetical protein
LGEGGSELSAESFQWGSGLAENPVLRTDLGEEGSVLSTDSSEGGLVLKAESFVEHAVLRIDLVDSGSDSCEGRSVLRGDSLFAGRSVLRGGSPTAPSSSKESSSPSSKLRALKNDASVESLSCRAKPPSKIDASVEPVPCRSKQSGFAEGVFSLD